MHTATSDYGEPTTEDQFIRPSFTSFATQPCKPLPVVADAFDPAPHRRCIGSSGLRVETRGGRAEALGPGGRLGSASQDL